MAVSATRQQMSSAEKTPLGGRRAKVVTGVQESVRARALAEQSVLASSLFMASSPRKRQRPVLVARAAAEASTAQAPDAHPAAEEEAERQPSRLPPA